MAWSGSWNNGRFTGTYTAEDGSMFTGTWTPPSQASGAGSADPPAAPVLSDYDPYTSGKGPRADDSDSTRRKAQNRSSTR
jgi:hypothetical protein